jgi:hypothetical protein
MICILFVNFFVVGIPGGAQPNSLDSSSAVAKQLAALHRAIEIASETHEKRLVSAKTETARQAILDAKSRQLDALAQRCLELAKGHPEDQAWAEALAWLVAYGEVRFPFFLPNSHIMVRYSTRRFRMEPGDRPSLDPEVLVQTSSADYFSLKDLLLEAALAYRAASNSGQAGTSSQDGRTGAYRRHGLDPTVSLESRVTSTPESVLKLFRESGRGAPKAHSLTREERTKLNRALKALPPLHRRVLSERLRGLSFPDGIPNTALTSTVNSDEPFRIYDIAINAAILGKTVSEWLTEKERTCFNEAGSSLRVSIEAGSDVDALIYVLLHEATHVVDYSQAITPPLSAGGLSWVTDKRPGSPFTEGIWRDLSLPAPAFRDPLRERLRFYTGNAALPVDKAQQVYESLRRTPFVSLYGGRNSLDDLAEYVSVYHLTEVLKQPYRIVIRRNDEEVFAYEPMKCDLVRRRIGQMKRFYETDS